MEERRLLGKLASGSFGNVAFGDLQRLLKAMGFVEVRRKGSHHIFAHSSVREVVNVQDVRGEAKPYQLRQIMAIVERHGLELGGDS